MEDVPQLLEHAQNLNLNLVGVSFHVGSGCYNVDAFSYAVHRSRRVFDMAQEHGFQLNLLDLGGGFPGNDENTAISFPDIADKLSTALDVHFPEGCGVDIIAEPGRYYVAKSHTLAVNIFGKKLKTIKNNEKNHMYYVNDGVYGSFNCVVNDHAKVKPNRIQKEGDMIIATPLLENDLAGKPTYNSSLWGPTCDGIDCFLKDIQLPKLEIGEWLYFSNMGAYTSAAGSQFNGFKLPEKHYINTASGFNTAHEHTEILMVKGQNSDH
jgi:ornithine decarboxylase